MKTILITGGTGFIGANLASSKRRSEEKKSRYFIG